MRVFLAGGSGQIGTRLIHKLTQRQDSVCLLTRRPDELRDRFGPGVELVRGDPTQPGDWMEALALCDGVINLTGENIFNRRWNDDFKKLLRDSRLRATQNIVQALGRARQAGGRPGVLVNASAIGYYGPHGDEELTEASPPGNDFLAGLCVDWETEARKAEATGARLALVRIGIVLDRRAGALRQMLLPFKLCIGGKVGSGRQQMSWIHHEDMVGILLLALDNSTISGPINATAPNPVSNKEFSRALGRALHRPAIFPVPGFALRLRFGGVAEVLLSGQRVLPRVALEKGYVFKFPRIDEALADAVKS